MSDNADLERAKDNILHAAGCYRAEMGGEAAKPPAPAKIVELVDDCIGAIEAKDADRALETAYAAREIEAIGLRKSRVLVADVFVGRVEEWARAVKELGA